MTLSTAEIQAVVRDLKGKLEGSRIERIDQPDRYRLILRVRRGSCRYWLLLCAHPRFSRIHLLTHRPRGKTPASGFCAIARRHLTGCPIQSIEQVENDRVVIIKAAGRDELQRPRGVRLIAELVGVGSNLVLVDDGDRVLGCLFTENSTRRKLAPGVAYQPLPAPQTLTEKAARNRFRAAEPTESDPLALGRAIQNTYAELETQDELQRLRSQTLCALANHLERLKRRLNNLKTSLAEAEDAESLRRKGELLKLALPRISKGDRCVKVADLFSEGQPEITIELDPTLTPRQNLEAYFNRYKKLKRSRRTVERRLRHCEQEIALFEQFTERASQAESAGEIEQVEAEAVKAGMRAPQAQPVGRRRQAQTGPRVFTSCDGLEILVARNERQNHKLTFSIARGNDYWLHLRDWPGPHVIVRKPPGKDVPLESLLDAAHLAIHYSKIRGAQFAEVVYTQRKYVRPLPGAGGGRVSFANASTLQVRFSRQRLERLLAGERNPETHAHHGG